MTKKDYIKIAAVLKAESIRHGIALNKYSAVRDMAIEFCTMLAQDNPRFDRARFLSACGF